MRLARLGMTLGIVAVLVVGCGGDDDDDVADSGSIAEFCRLAAAADADDSGTPPTAGELQAARDAAPDEIADAVETVADAVEGASDPEDPAAVLEALDNEDVAAAIARLEDFEKTNCGAATPASTSSAPQSSDQAAIEDTIKTWLTEGGCENMTASFLEDQTFIDDPGRACDRFNQLFTEPQFDRDDIVVTDIRVTGADATAIVGDDGISNIESTYMMRNEDGRWKIDSVDL